MMPQTKTPKRTRPAPKPDLSHIAPNLRPLAVPVGDLAFLVGNPLKHPDEQLEDLKASFREFGQVDVLVVNKRPKPAVVIGGNGRLAAATDLGWSHVAVSYVDLDPMAANALAVTLNRTQGTEWDAEALDKILTEMRGTVAVEDPRLEQMFEELGKEQGLENHEPTGGAPVTEEDAGDEDEDALDLLFKAPFPYFGGKARIAKKVWQRFGSVTCYVEPFFGSGAVLLNRPEPFESVETINDADGLICNFWRAVQAEPKKVAKFADWPVNESDLHARHSWLVAHRDSLQAKLEGDPDHFDVKAAGWWCWGMACWIGSGFCSGEGPWQIVEGEDGSRQLVHLGDAGQGVNRKRVHLGDAGQGVNRQRVHLSGAGQGEESQSRAGCGERGLLAWMEALSERLRRVRVCCGDWTRVCGGDSGDALQHFFACGEPCGVFLDPPYADTADRDPTLYRKDSQTVAHAVRKWAIAHGDDPRLRIALCGYEGEHVMPGSWECVAWRAPGGYASQSKNGSQATVNRFRERVWFSKFCLDV